MIGRLLRKYRTKSLSVRASLQEWYERASVAPAGIWIKLISPEQLESYISDLERCDPNSLPLYGIPFAIKDNIDLAGIPTTAGCPAYAYVPKRSAHVVEQLVVAGAVPFGKTNLDQFATGLVGVRSPYGIAPNRSAPGYVPGGSSSGSAVAVAQGYVAFALGTDTAGSGRVPAAFNELVGLKPTRGRLSTRGVVPACRTLDCVSIFANSVADAKLVLNCASGFDPEDAYSRSIPASELRLPEKWRFGVPSRKDLEFFGNTDYEQAFQQSIQVMEALGGIKVEIDFLPFRLAAQLLYEGPWVFERYAAVGKFIEEHPGDVHPVIQEIITPKKLLHPSEVFQGMYRLQELKLQSDLEFEKMELLLTPTTGTIYRVEEVLADPIHLNSNLGYYTNFMNLLDYAAIAIPARQAGKLPFGITLAGKSFSESLLMKVASRFGHAIKQG